MLPGSELTGSLNFSLRLRVGWNLAALLRAFNSLHRKSCGKQDRIYRGSDKCGAIDAGRRAKLSSDPSSTRGLCDGVRQIQFCPER